MPPMFKIKKIWGFRYTQNYWNQCTFHALRLGWSACIFGQQNCIMHENSQDTLTTAGKILQLETTIDWSYKSGIRMYIDAEFVVPFSSRSRSLTLKSPWKSHQMTPFFVQKEVLGEKVIIWVRYGNFFTQIMMFSL